MKKLIIASTVLLMCGCGGVSGAKNPTINPPPGDNSSFVVTEDTIKMQSGWEASMGVIGITIESQRSSGGWTAEMQ